MKKYFNQFWILCSFLFLAISAFPQQPSLVTIENTPAETDSIITIAQKQIHNFISDIPQNQLPDYGFNDIDELNNIAFGQPILIYTIQNKQLIFTNTWRVPAMVKGSCRGLLTIIKNKDQYEAVDYGAKLLAQQFYMHEKHKPLGLLRIYEIQSDFVIVKNQDDQIRFYPINNPENKAYDFNEVINLMQQN